MTVYSITFELIIFIFTMKTCTKCKKEKPRERFRKRIKRGYIYTQGKCMDCEAKEQNARYHKDIVKSRERKLFHLHARPEHVKKAVHKKTWEKRKGTKEWKEYRAKYWRSNHEQRLKHQEIARKHHEHARDNLTDAYIIGQIRQKARSIRKEDIPAEFIEVYRLFIIFKRMIYGNRQKANQQTEPVISQQGWVHPTGQGD